LPLPCPTDSEENRPCIVAGGNPLNDAMAVFEAGRRATPGADQGRRAHRQRAGQGRDVVHYGTVVVAATGIGLFLPPIGVGFFIACGIANVPRDRAPGAMMPYVYMMCAGLLVVILVPWVTLVLPRMRGLG
jgi:hypothetical protein